MSDPNPPRPVAKVKPPVAAKSEKGSTAAKPIITILSRGDASKKE